MAIKYLATGRLYGTTAERVAMTTGGGFLVEDVEWDTNNLNNMEVPTTPEWTSADGISNASPLVGSVLKKDYGTTGWNADARSVGTYLGGSGVELISVITSYKSFQTATYGSTFKLSSGNFSASSESRVDILGWYVNGDFTVFHYNTNEQNNITYATSTLTKLKTVLETNGQTKFWYSNGSGLDDTYTLVYTDTTDRTDEVYKVWGIFHEDNGESVTITRTPVPIVYPNLPNGTIFEESDGTGKHYMWDGTSAWNETIQA